MNFAHVCATIIVLCLPQYQASAEALQCYKCNSSTERECFRGHLEPFKHNCSYVQKPDSPVHNVCRTWYIELDPLVDKLTPDERDVRIIRDCGWDDPEYVNRCYQTMGTGGKKVVCSCEGDYCNSASISIPGQIFIIVLIATLNLYYYIL